MTRRGDADHAATRAAKGKALWPEEADRTSGLRLRPRPERDDDTVGGHYRLIAPIGDTAYGRAFRAEHLRNGREVAVHFFTEGVVPERVLSRELPLAVAKCAQLSHPNVVSLHAYGRTDGAQGVYYVVTDMLEGVSLSQYLRERGPLSPTSALALVRQIGRALRAAHKLGVFHGDLRPANVRVVEVDQRAVLKVVGFGKLPLLCGGDEPASHVRGIAAPIYAAPELLRGEAIDARADVYALGAMLFRMIAGTAPFAGRTPSEVLQSMEASPPSLRAFVGDEVSEDVDALVTRCLTSRPEERFPDVVAMMRAMRFVLLDETDFLSREMSDPLATTPPLSGAQSILPSVSPSADITGARQAILAHEGSKARTRTILIAIGIVLALGIAGEVWLGATGGTPVLSAPVTESR